MDKILSFSCIGFLVGAISYLVIPSFGQATIEQPNRTKTIVQEIIKPSNDNDSAIPKHKREEKAATIVENRIPEEQKLKLFTTLFREQNEGVQGAILKQLSDNWEDEFIPVLIEIMRFSRDPRLLVDIQGLLTEKTKRKTFQGFFDWLQWLWDKPPIYGAYYGDFKAAIHKNIDPKFEKYFSDRQAVSHIRLDEVVWGGVVQDGIPPLRGPKMLAASDVDYLDDDNIVFGFYLNGIARAYPKRILAWHEFFTDDFDGLRIAGVYCTLCGTVIAYDMTYEGVFHDLGTSGFLYRSNKLMYDQATQSLWNTIEGKPVIGPLVGKDIVLDVYPVITTTWGEWRKKHPDTEVLSLDTGHYRDYDEGAAYRDYFATDQLMFPVPKDDNRLANKAEVLVLRIPGYKEDPIAISIDYLRRKKWFKGQVKDTPFIVLADKTGAARVYASEEIVFKSFKKGILKDDKGNSWSITEDTLQLENKTLKRIPSHSIFWFAWYNAYPETRLIR